MKEAPKDHIACESTVLHQSTSIQNGCDLVMIDPQDMGLIAINQSLYTELQAPTALSDIIYPADCSQIKQDIATKGGLSPRIVTRKDGKQVWARPFRTDHKIGVEFSPKDEPLTINENSNHYFAFVVKELSQRHETSMKMNTESEQDYFQVLAKGVRHLAKFDRVMIYKFDPDWNGEVIAEDVGDNIERFFGLKFPAGDIPRPARDLFLRSKVRQIINVDGDPEPMITPETEQPFLFDQTDSTFRYSSPIHCDYLRNMGVTASLTIAIHVAGRLWGLVSCHHKSGPHRISMSELTLCHVLSDLASSHVARQEEQRKNSMNAEMSEVLSDISVASIAASSEDDLANIVVQNENRLLQLLRADGIQFESETANWIVGEVPKSDQLRVIDHFAQDWLQTHKRGVFATSDLAGFLGEGQQARQVSGGLLYSHSWDHKTCLKVFRKGLHVEDVWAGDPDAKTHYTLANDNVLHPRNSFEAYKSFAKDRSENWQQEEISAVDVLQLGLRNIEMSFHKSLRERQLRHSNAEMRNALIKADHQANHDPLTGLLNRRGFDNFVSGLVQRSNRKDCLWFCHIDLDFFKRINDERGHHAGDAMLTRVAAILTSAEAKGSSAARIGGDEFALILSGNLSKSDARAIGKKVIADLAETQLVDGQDISMGCTIGITKFAPGDVNLERLLKESDIALYHGKRLGRGRVVFFTQDMEDASSRRRQQEADLLRGIAAKEFVPYFQPQYDCETEKIVGFEALSRWRHPTKGILQPSDFLPLAAELGVMGDIDRLIFEKAVEHQIEWFSKTDEAVRLSVNISVDRLQSLDLITDLEELGEWTRFISLELLEDIYLDDHEVDYEGILESLRDTGVDIEIDDFGTGRTSILAVVSVKPDRLKIDKRLIDPIVSDDAARGLVKAIMDIGGQLGIKIIAEGVETEDQLRVLQSLKCDRVQGYLFSRPVAPIKIEKDFLTAAWQADPTPQISPALMH
ncbi:MAG: EAL domain-containing protein [Paracoccaceae bacterium]